MFTSDSQPENERLAAEKVMKKAVKIKPPTMSKAEFRSAFEPIMRADHIFPPPTGRLAPSFENGMAPISEDLAPYIRAIVAFDLRLEQHRLELSGLLSQGGGTKRMRKTRASRAALEGGDKANTRRERWFTNDINPSLVLATGGKEWQDILVQNGYFNVMPVVEQRRGSSRSISESSGDGGF